MQEPITFLNRRLEIDQDDQQALELFNNIELQASKSQSAHQPLQQLNQSHNSIDSAPRLNRLSKLKTESKKQKKNRKKKQKHRLKKKKHHKQADLSAPRKKIKREGSSKKKKDSEGEEAQGAGDQGSSQFDSQSNNQLNLDEELKNLNPDYAENNSAQGQSPKKRLIKSGRKERIQDREGFKITQLGNDGQASLSQVQNSEDLSYMDRNNNKKSKKKKLRMKVPTNQQIMNIFKEHGVVESEGEGQQGHQKQYDSGLDMLNSLKSKKSGNGIRINNRMFGDLEVNLQNQEAQMPLPQNLQLELKPKPSVSSQRFSFLSRAETIKKQRGLQADVNVEEFQRIAQQKAKKSMAKVVSSMVSQQFHEDLDVQIRVPAIARGKSADIINNTVYLRKFANKIENNDNQQAQIPLAQTKSMGQPNISKREAQSRNDFFRQIMQQNRLRRSKYISQEQLKNSFKKTNLQELQQARKRIQQKKRKQALSDESEKEQQIDSHLQQMIEKQQMVCGDINKEDQMEQNPKQNQMQEVNVSVQIKEMAQNEVENQQNELQKENEELQQYKEIIQQLQSVSEQQEQENSAQNEEDSESIHNPSQNQEQNEQNQSSQHVNQPQVNQNVEQKNEEMNQQNQKAMRQLLQEGIISRKRGFNKLNVSQQRPKEDQSGHRQDAQPQIAQQARQAKENEELGSTNKKEDYDQQDEEFDNFKKLRKIAKIIAKKKKEIQQGRRYASQFIQQEAQEGSDNQEHDDFVKKIDYDEEDKQFAGMNLDEDLEELIDNFVDLNQENQFEAFKKYQEDIRIKDKEQLRKIIRGEFHKKHEDLQIEMEEDQKKRQQRMQEVMNWMKKRQEEEGENLYLKSPEKQNSDSQDQSSEYSGKHKKAQVQEVNEQEKVAMQEQFARLEKFISQTLPSSKRELIKPAKQLIFLPLPESVKLEKKPSSQKAISMSKLGSKIVPQANPQHLMSLKNTSSLVNKILNKSSYRPKPLLAPAKAGKKK